jgi:hypothetical protein
MIYDQAGWRLRSLNKDRRDLYIEGLILWFEGGDGDALPNRLEVFRTTGFNESEPLQFFPHKRDVDIQTNFHLSRYDCFQYRILVLLDKHQVRLRHRLFPWTYSFLA